MLWVSGGHQQLRTAVAVASPASDNYKCTQLADDLFLQV